MPARANVGDLWVADTDNGCTGGNFGGIYRVDPSTHAITPLSVGGILRSPDGIASAPDGRTLYVSDANAFDPTPPTFTMGADCPYSNPWDGNGGVIAIDTATGAQRALSGESDPDDWGDPAGIAWDPSTSTLVVIGPGASTGPVLARVDPATGDRTVIDQTDFVNPSAVTVAANGDIYVTDQGANAGGGSPGSGDGRVLELAGGAGPATVVSQDASALYDPAGIALAATGALVVTDLVAGNAGPGFITVNPAQPATSNASLMAPSAPTPPSFCDTGGVGAPWERPMGIAPGPGGFVVADPEGPEPMWCSGVGVATNNGIVGSIDLSATSAWMAGGDAAATPWKDPVAAEPALNRPPQAAATVPSEVLTGAPVTIDASGSSDPDGDALTYAFDGGDPGGFHAAAGPGSSFTGSFSTPGLHFVTVTVNDGFGGTSVAITGVHVSDPIPPGSPPDAGGNDPSQTPGGTTSGTPGSGSTPPGTTTTTVPASLTLDQLLSPSGVTIPLACSADCTVTGSLQISASSFKSLTAAAKLLTLGKGSVKLKAGKKGKLRIKLTAKVRKRLKHALGSASAAARRKIRLQLTLSSKYKSGAKKTIRRKIVLKG